MVLVFLAFSLVGLAFAEEPAGESPGRKLGVIAEDYLMLDVDPSVFRRIDGRITGTPPDCCSQCAVGGLTATNTNIPIAAHYQGSLVNQSFGLHGQAVLSDPDLEAALLCVNGYAGSTNCKCRLDVGIYSSFHYLCENTSMDAWRYEGNTILTGGPYNQLTVDSVMLNLMFPWVERNAMLWVSLFQVTDKEPCKIKNVDERHIKYVDTRFDMSQFNYYFYPNETLTVPSAWTFVSEPEHDDDGFWRFKEVGTFAHFEQGSVSDDSP